MAERAEILDGAHNGWGEEGVMAACVVVVVVGSRESGHAGSAISLCNTCSPSEPVSSSSTIMCSEMAWFTTDLNLTPALLTSMPIRSAAPYENDERFAITLCSPYRADKFAGDAQRANAGQSSLRPDTMVGCVR